MITKQEVLDHIKIYFKNRVDKYHGVTISGWGSEKYEEERCALGSLVRGEVISVKREVNKLLNLNFEDLPFFHFYRQITEFNDYYCMTNPHYRLTYKIIDQFLINLASKNFLKYSPMDMLYVY